MGGIAVHIGARWRAAPHPVRSSSPAPSGTWSRARACASWIVARTTSTTCPGVAPLRGGGLSGLTRGSSSTVGSRAGARRHERHGETSYLGACDAPKKRTSAERAKIRRRRTLSAKSGTAFHISWPSIRTRSNPRRSARCSSTSSSPRGRRRSRVHPMALSRSISPKEVGDVGPTRPRRPGRVVKRAERKVQNAARRLSGQTHQGPW